MRFIPAAYRDGCDRIAPWFSQKTLARLELEAAIQQHVRIASNDVDSLSCSQDHTMSADDYLKGNFAIDDQEEWDPWRNGSPRSTSGSFRRTTQA